MTYKGHIQNGQVVLDEQMELPDGTEVVVQPVPHPSLTAASDDESLPTHYEQFRSIIGTVTNLPHDMADNHDHYIHGTPKK